jgi:CheY-like chemotaxis protein
VFYFLHSQSGQIISTKTTRQRRRVRSVRRSKPFPLAFGASPTASSECPHDVGYSVRAATDGVAGLAEARERSPDLIITDNSMPNLTGVEMIRQLCPQAEFERLPMLVLTADSVVTAARRRDGRGVPIGFSSNPYRLMRSSITLLSCSRTTSMDSRGTT